MIFFLYMLGLFIIGVFVLGFLKLILGSFITVLRKCVCLLLGGFFLVFFLFLN